jgi:hypothetical protein
MHNKYFNYSQSTISIFQAVDDVIDYSANCIQRATICHSEIDVVIVVKMLVQHVEINICKGWIAVKVQLLLLVAEDEEF